MPSLMPPPNAAEHHDGDDRQVPVQVEQQAEREDGLDELPVSCTSPARRGSDALGVVHHHDISTPVWVLSK